MTRPWTCYSNFLTCDPGGKEHLIRFKSERFSADMRRVSGHAFIMCDQCKPATYFFVVYATTPDPHATCHPISRESYLQWYNEGGAESKSTPEMLYLLRDPAGQSLNPTWRPPR